MYRHIKRFLPAVLSLLLLCGIAVTAAARSALEEAKQAPPTSDVPVQEEAYDAYMRLMGGLEEMAAGDMPDAAAASDGPDSLTSYGPDGAVTAAPEESQPSTSQYPEFYGGSYTNENGQLVLCVPEGASVPEEISELIGDNYVVETVAYSYAYLKNVMKQINDYLCENIGNDAVENVSMVALRDNKNVIEVYLADCSPERIEEFKANISDSPAIIFTQGGRMVELASIDPGSSLYNGTTRSSASCGYRAMRNGEVGFVTSAHFANYGDTIYAAGANVVQVTARNYENDGKVDAAFCKVTNANYTPSNIIAGTTNVLSTIISEPGVSTNINMVGAVSGHLNGYVTATDVTTLSNSGIILTNIMEADFLAAPGDSGGIVYSYIGSTNTRMTIGIINGVSEATGCTYVSKANNINSALGTTRY